MSVRDARRWTQAKLDRWELDALRVDDAVLLTSELGTNAVLHARTPFTVHLAVAAGVLEIAVTDHDPRLPPWQGASPALHIAGPATDSPRDGGRGLLLVDQLADERGVASDRTGKQVWFRLAIATEWPHHRACRCAYPTSASSPLASGSRVRAISGPWDQVG